jgi:hypothetical protein
VAAYPFHYWWAVRNQYLTEMKRQLDAIEEQRAQSEGYTDYDRKFGIGRKSRGRVMPGPTTEWSTQESVTGEPVAS